MHIGHASRISGTSRSAPPRDRRAPADPSAKARLRWLRGLIRRPFKVLWRAGLPRLAWVERRQAPAQDPGLMRLRADLRAELLALGDDALALRELMRVEEQLDEAGWAGVAALPGRVLVRAAVQAEMLAATAASPALTDLAARLRALQPSAQDGPATTASATLAWPAAGPIEVLELGDEDYAQAERLWADSQRAGLAAAPPAPSSAPPKDGEIRA